MSWGSVVRQLPSLPNGDGKTHIPAISKFSPPSALVPLWTQLEGGGKKNVEEACLPRKNVGSEVTRATSAHTPLVNVTQYISMQVLLLVWQLAEQPCPGCIVMARMGKMDLGILQPSYCVESLGPHPIAQWVRSGIKHPGVWNSAWSLTCPQEVLSKSGPQFPHLSKGGNSIYPNRVVMRIK